MYNLSTASPDEHSDRKVGARRSGVFAQFRSVKIPDSLAALGFRDRRNFYASAPGGCTGFVSSAAMAAQSSLPMATAVSAMRLEKPHSLSYQERTRTSLPSITLV